MVLAGLLALVEDTRFAGALHAEPRDPAAAYALFSREHAAPAGPAAAKPKPGSREALRQSAAGQPAVAALCEVILGFLSHNIRLALEVGPPHLHWTPTYTGLD